MATSLTFTSSAFAKATQFSASTTANTLIDVVTVDATYTRRVYGIHLLSKDATAQTITVSIHNGTSAFDVYTVAVTGTTTGVAFDIFGNINGDGIFNKQKDANGTPYFNLPAGWKIQMSYTTAIVSPEVINVILFGETYA